MIEDINSESNLSNHNKVKRYSHQPITVEHYGTHITIRENGTIILSRAVAKNSVDEIDEVDEIEVPASLIFKVARLLKDTQKIEYISVASTK